MIRFEGYVIDRPGWALRWADEPIALNRKSFDLLLYLIDHNDRVVGKEELLQALWPEQFVEESNLSQQIFLVRKALSRHESGRKIIETVPGRGYRFVAPVELEPAPESQEQIAQQIVLNGSESITRITLEEEVEEEPEMVVPAGLPAPPQRASRGLTVFAACALVIALAAGSWFAWQRWLNQTGGTPIQAVLILADGTTGDTVLDQSLTDALRMDLSQSPHLTVLSGATVRAVLTQMRHKPDEQITLPVAREICERTNSQAVLHGSIARNGQHYLLTEEATNCVDGAPLAQAKREAEKAEDLPHAIDELAATLRQKLGESRRSIRRFNAPLFQGDNTASLEALKAYTRGTEQLRQGNYPAAITLFRASVTSDPRFAAGWWGLAAGYGSEGDDVDARAAVEDGYKVKDTASQDLQFILTSANIEYNTQDMFARLRNDESWTELYPNSLPAWTRLGNNQRDLAKYSEAVISGKRAIALVPTNIAANVGLITSLIQAGDLGGAHSALDQAIANHLDSDSVRIRYLELAWALHDPAMLEAQRAWLKDHPDSATVVLGEARIAVSEGRFADARRLALRSSEIFHEQGVAGAGDRFLKSVAVEMIESGDIEEGKKLFQSVSPDTEEGQDLLGMVYAGDTAKAMSALHTMQAKYPNGTLWNLYYGPQIHATISMMEHKPGEAATILEAASPIELRELYVPWMRGEAYLEAGDAARAEVEFRKVITYLAADPASCAISLSWLGLARSLAAEKNRAGAIDAYQHFLSLWAHADADALYLHQAKQELTAIQTLPASK